MIAASDGTPLYRQGTACSSPRRDIRVGRRLNAEPARDDLERQVQVPLVLVEMVLTVPSGSIETLAMRAASGVTTENGEL